MKETIKSQIEDLERLFQDVDKAESRGKRYGYSGIPYCLKRLRESGLDKIFLVSSNYRGLYEDDYCTFCYWDESRKEMFYDEWTTAAACPSFGLYEFPIRFNVAWESGLVDKDAYLDHLRGSYDKFVDRQKICGIEEMIGLPVKVSGGRKWKGEGFLISINDIYKSRYKTSSAIVYDPSTNTIQEVNPDFVELNNTDEIMESYRGWARGIISGLTIEDIDPVRVSVNVDFSIKRYLSLYRASNPIDMSTASYPAQEERDRKEASFKQKKMKDLIEWVKNNTDKTGEEIEILANRIYNKRYASA